MRFLEAHSQIASLLVLAFTSGAILWQAIEAGKQAKASVRMAKTSLAQTELMRTQIYESLRPVVTVAGGEYGPNIATLTLKNLGAGAALGIIGIYRSGFRQRVGGLSAEESVVFRFDNSLNQNPRLVGPPITKSGTLGAANGDVSLRLEYQSVSGANCWTMVDFKLGGEGGVEIDEIKHGMDFPSLTTNL
jgi:hypothetical protein